jgi:hypothetical protein
MTEIVRSEADGVALDSGFRPAEELSCDYCVDGVMLPRPFKITKVGPVNLFVADIDASERFYTELFGLTRTEEVRYRGHRCIYLRCGTDHHVIGLFPVALRQELGLNPATTLMSIGMQVATYRQLRDAIAFMRERDLRFVDSIPSDLHPGIDYAAHAVGFDGHCIQLYHSMEQIGWDGRPRPATQRPRVAPDWPQTLEGTPASYVDQFLQGPLG